MLPVFVVPFVYCYCCAIIVGIHGLNFVSEYMQNQALQIKLLDGTVQGQLKRTVDVGMPYYSYEGIPYAKPPVGELRFKPPEPPEKWNGTLHANGDVPICMQIPPNKDWFESEDCLYVNVYTPKNPRNASDGELLAVMAWIYGGGFMFGYAASPYYGPDHILAENVIVVDFNYRLNVFGFLSTDDMSSPGNYGLKDQLLALRWIKDNIKFFGGDPNKITIFGESAGGASVQYHLLSNQTRGLYRNAISESGSVLCPWALQKEPAKVALQVAVASGIFTTNTADIIGSLRSLPAQKLRRAAVHASILNTMNAIKSLPFAPTIEPEHDGAFITYKSYQKLKDGKFVKVPYLTGYNSQESAVFQIVLQSVELLLQWFGRNSDALIPADMNVDPEQYKEVVQEIKAFYFENQKPTTEQYLDFISDSYFNRPIIASALAHSASVPVYMYKFSYQGYIGKRALHLDENEIKGVMHSEEVWYIFSRSDLTRANLTDKIIRRQTVKLWANFAKYSNPTPSPEKLLQNMTWLPIKSIDDRSYLEIDNVLSLKKNDKAQSFKFWQQLYEKYGRPPFDTY